jgi:hypothetical protein
MRTLKNFVIVFLDGTGLGKENRFAILIEYPSLFLHFSVLTFSR